MNPFRKKKKLENEVNLSDIIEQYNRALLEREALHMAQVNRAMELDLKRDKSAYIR